MRAAERGERNAVCGGVRVANRDERHDAIFGRQHNIPAGIAACGGDRAMMMILGECG